MVSYLKHKIIIDSREKKGWDFDGCEKTVAALKTGDYTLEGLEDVLCIERKGSILELAQNLLDERFERELERMTHRYKYLVCEFEFDDLISYPNSVTSNWLRNKIKVNGKFLLRKLLELQMKYNFVPLFVGHHGEDVVLSIFLRMQNVKSN